MSLNLSKSYTRRKTGLDYCCWFRIWEWAFFDVVSSLNFWIYFAYVAGFLQIWRYVIAQAPVKRRWLKVYFSPWPRVLKTLGLMERNAWVWSHILKFILPSLFHADAESLDSFPFGLLPTCPLGNPGFVFTVDRTIWSSFSASQPLHGCLTFWTMRPLSWYNVPLEDYIMRK